MKNKGTIMVMVLALLMVGTRGQDVVNTEIFEQEVNEGLSLGNK